MIDLQQKTQKYVDVLLQLLPQGLYDNALDTDVETGATADGVMLYGAPQTLRFGFTLRGP